MTQVLVEEMIYMAIPILVLSVGFIAYLILAGNGRKGEAKEDTLGKAVEPYLLERYRSRWK